jgi:hypothetical protein
MESLPSKRQDIAACTLAQKGVYMPLCHFGQAGVVCGCG